MPVIRELNLGLLEPIGGPPGLSGCRSLLIETSDGFALVDTGFGLAELQFTEKLFGGETKKNLGIHSDPDLSALVQIQKLGLRQSDVRHILCTHLDVDHAGGLVDFPRSLVHVSYREHESLVQKNPRYYDHQFQHGPQWVVTDPIPSSNVLGLPGWQIDLTAELSIYLIPLYGHTRGHCGVVITDGDSVLLHAGDAYYRREELGPGHPSANDFPVRTAEDDGERLARLDLLASSLSDAPKVTVFCTHDLSEAGTGFSRLPSLPGLPL